MSLHAEQLEILAFLKEYSPYNQLPDSALEEAVQQLDVAYYKAGSQILSLSDRISDWYIIRSGSVEVYRRNGNLYNRLTSGGHFGEFSLLHNRPVRFPTVALEDTLVYLLPEALFNQFFDEYDAFSDRVEVEDATRLRNSVAQREDANELMTAPIESLISQAPLILTANTNCHQTAVEMTNANASAALIADDDGQIIGIVTDKDLRDRLITPALPYHTPVSEIMSPDIQQVDHQQFVFEAMLLMLRYNVHHLPVTKKEKTIGIVCLPDMIRHESQNSLFIVSSIFKANNLDELTALKPAVRACFVRMVQQDANSRMIGGAMALLGRSFKQRLLELAEQRLGPAPIKYCFLALGSMAREEQLIVTDQDNALVLSDEYNASQHGEYFAQLADFVCDGLDACGYVYCKGGIMASNSEWRQPLHVWKQYFSRWIDEPSPQSLLDASIFFDLEGVHGETQWARDLNRLIKYKAQNNPRFIACMARNALQRTPPLGFFKDFVMETDGRHTNSINMKSRGTAPLADLIRVHALATGIKARNSFERLNDIMETDVLPRGRGADLRDALELISMVRIRHQALEIESQNEPDNNIEPENLSDFERKNLRDAFQILSNAQKYLKFKYQPGRVN
ncbi:DUF294 nucleotidyltransferase-like domain-containing protein [Gayadomonas joobiniege]|uniref:DUF294 nucleotidyltransferase-like domain-containing protein n=1 Tax=Gayadomonas joobiniege TaxID=1234606 RepID=UPI0003730F99|nr:DUF294 nucleotidyltransferase-like domain-containing protein [Gayadomonas joobiniege]